MKVNLGPLVNSEYYPGWLDHWEVSGRMLPIRNIQDFQCCLLFVLQDCSKGLTFYECLEIFTEGASKQIIVFFSNGPFEYLSKTEND